VDVVSIEGNKKTRNRIIHRELDFHVGDSLFLLNISDQFERNRNNLLNTGLFNDVDINIKDWDTEARKIHIVVTVLESWYIYIVPILELADRNFNVWWQEHNHALNRLNFGARLQYLNSSGNNDPLKLILQVGYTPKVEIKYNLPYFDKKQKFGFGFNVFHAINKEVGYQNFNNKQLFIKDNDRKLLRRSSLGLSFNHRPSIYLLHKLEINFHLNKVDTLIASDRNPSFFLNGLEKQRYFFLNYEGSYDNRDVKIYPTKGMHAGMGIKKRGLGVFGDINLLEIYPFFEKFFSLSPKLSVGSKLKAKYSLIRDKPPYYDNKGLGYGTDFIRGYELYVIDGLDYYYAKTSLKVLIVDKSIQFGKMMPLQPFRQMPLKIYLAFNFDIGYVHEAFYKENNDFTNRTLYGWGPAINFVLYNNFAFELEYSFNHLKEKGLFLHNKISF
jgi:outer membrane protein assembly factor BamA